MAYEALDSLQQTLLQILKRDDDLTTHRVKQYIISSCDKAAVLQLKLKAFPEKETIREVASTALVIIEYLFSPENLSDCGSIEPSVRVSNQLRDLAEELDSIVGDVVDYCKVQQQGDYPALSGLSQRLERLAEKILWSRRDLADYSRSKDIIVGIDEDLSYSCSAADAVSSSSRSASTSKDVVVGIDENLSYSCSAADAVSSSSRSAPTSSLCTPDKAYEALDSLLQTLTQILKRDDDLTTRCVKRDILSIHNKAAVLQSTLEAFPAKERIREVASTTHETIEYLFSPENLSDFGSIEPDVGVSNQLRELAEELDLILWSPRDLAHYSRGNDNSVNSRSFEVVGIDEDPSSSAADAVSSSSRSAPTSSLHTPARAYEALDSLLQKLTQILKRNDHLTTRRVKRDIISIHTKAAVLQLNLEAFPEKETIREVASTTHDIIEYLFSPENLSDCGSIEPSVRVSNQLRGLAEELDLIVGDVVDYCKVIDLWQQSDYPAPSGLSQRLERLAEKILSSPRDLADDSVNRKSVVVGIDKDLSYSAADAVSSSSRPAPTIKDGVVGFEEDLIQILDRLTGGLRDTQVLSIVGMGGIGKTTLAKIVYDHPMITKHFDVRGWVTVSQDYSVGITCSNLLASMKGKRIQAERCADEISDSLVLKKYLIVMDDMWSKKALDDMKKLFRDNDNGSSIILTTRLLDVAIYAVNTYWFGSIHKVGFLDEQQSWDLFQQKVFADQTCPLELQSVAKKIVRSCGGLPLSIVTVAELLSKIGRTPMLWEQIVATDGGGQLESILSLSYNHLPHHLKDCFLYMAGFPQDYEIRVSELIKLWITEGFIVESQYGSKYLEEMAEEYLKDLVKKSLVLVTRRKIGGKIKSCRLQNNVRDFCVRQAGQKKFLLPVMDYLPTPILRRHFLPQLLKNHRRISASWYDLDLRDSMHSSCTHSIICIPQKGYTPKGSVRSFSSLRVLHVLRRDDRSYWELGQVFHLIHLRYLASNIPSSIVPPAISKLHNLQTLIIYRHGVLLPVEIWRLQQLRHLIAFSFDPLPQPEAAALPLENLKTLLLATNLVCSGRMVEMIPNIQKLGICYSREKFDEVYHFDNLAHLRRLEKLKLEILSGSFWPSLSHVFPLSLKKLTLSGCRLPWSDIVSISWLPNLEVLKLRNHACDGEQWETTYGEFRSLRLLLIDESNVQLWESNSYLFPVLECLMLHRCPYLSEIPSDIGEIPTLELIEVDDLNLSLFNSAKQIQEVQQQMYDNYDLKVRLKRF